MGNSRGSGRRNERIAGEDRRSLRVTLIADEELDALALVFSGRKLAAVRSIYMGLVRLVRDASEFTRAELADEAGVTARTLDEYVPVLEEHGFITVERRPDPAGRGNLPNLWTLATPLHLRGEAGAPGGEADRRVQSSSTSQDDAHGAGGSEEGGLAIAAELGVPPDMLIDAGALLKRKAKVDGKIVRPEEMVVAAAALAEFNRQLDSDYGLGANLRAMVMRIRERPSWDAAKHQRLVQSAFRVRWWEGRGSRRRATPAVIYGNERVFEQVAMDAAEEARGKAPEQVAERRFQRRGAAERQS